MSQAEILNLLKDKKRRTAKQIGSSLNLSQGSINTSLKILLKYGEVKVYLIPMKGYHRTVQSYGLYR